MGAQGAQGPVRVVSPLNFQVEAGRTSVLAENATWAKSS